MFIKNKAAEYRRCLELDDDAIPPCSAEERWERPPKFAVMKTGLKRAVRLFDERETAERLDSESGNNHYVEHRKRESVKCRSFCLCCHFCNYYRDSVLAGTENTDNGVKTAA
jgi:hypothetical protein